MEAIDYWRFVEELTVVQAALLTLGIDPASETGSFCERWDIHMCPAGYQAVKIGISTALKNGLITGTVIPIAETDINGNVIGDVRDSIDPSESRVSVKSFQRWLAERGVKNGFFFLATTVTVDYLDKSDSRYAPKLAAAVRAWQAVTNPVGKTPKQALAKWLREHAAEYGMVDEDGKPNELGIEETSKVANRKPDGGAAKTPNK